MSEPPYDPLAMLAAFRETRGPDDGEEESLWTRLELDVAIDPLPNERKAAAPWRMIFVAAGAIAAAFVLGWWLRGMPSQAVESDSGSADLANYATTETSCSTGSRPEVRFPWALSRVSTTD